jgi:hypothetical protein
MATLGSNVLTLTDWAKRLDPKGKIQKTVELLSQTNEILKDMLYAEGNLPTGHRTSIRTGLPSVYWRLMNQGVAPSKSTTAQVDEQCGMLEAWSEVDKDLAELNGNVGSFRLNEAMAFLEAMNQEMADTLFYGSAANPEEFVGFSNRYSDLSATNGQNILDAGGSGSDNSSVWLVGWGANECFGVFPQGSKAGIDHEDLGLVTVETTAGIAGNRMRAYQDHWQWKNGLVVKDWRYVARIANIDISDLAGLATTQATTASTFIVKMMSRAIDRLPTLSGISPVFYANRTVMSLLRVAALEKSSSAVSIEPGLNQFGQNIFETKFLGIPVRLVDRLTITETQIT